MERVNIDKVYHPFITGAYNKLVGEMMQETGARINVPPPSVNKTEIVITGEKEQVALAVAMIKKISEDKVCYVVWVDADYLGLGIKGQMLLINSPLYCRRRMPPPLQWR